MKKYKKVHFLVLMLIGVFMLTACKKEAQTSKEEETPKVTTTTEPEDLENEESPDDMEKEDIVSPSPNPDKETSIDIYGINEDTLESEPANAKIKGEVTAESIVQAVVDSFATHSIDIGIDKITQEKNQVIVSFKNDMAPIAEVGSDVEETILNCISDSLMDNLDNCKSVIFRSEDGAYESGHLAFGIDQVYASE